jgi:hypothetical protein
LRLNRGNAFAMPFELKDRGTSGDDWDMGEICRACGRVINFCVAGICSGKFTLASELLGFSEDVAT